MSSHLESFAQWTENAGLFTVGTDLFIGHIPPKRADGTPPPDRCVVLLERAGGTVHFDLPDRVDKAVQVLSRAKNYTDARDDNEAVYNAIHGNAGLDLPSFGAASGSDYIAMTIEAYSYPAPIGQDDAHRWQWSSNYIVRIRE